jgi:hypothetical protein
MFPHGERDTARLESVGLSVEIYRIDLPVSGLEKLRLNINLYI